MFYSLLDGVVGSMGAKFGSDQNKIATLSRILPSFVKKSTWQN